MTTPTAVVACELVLQTSSGEHRHPVNVLVVGHHVSVAEGITLTIDTYLEVHGFRVEMPAADWVRMLEANHPGLKVTATGVAALAVITNDEAYRLHPGDSLAIYDDRRLPAPPPAPADQVAALEAKVADLEAALWHRQELGE